MTKSWDNAKKPESKERKAAVRLKVGASSEEKFRLIGQVLPRYVYWVTTVEGKKMPVECLAFDRETEDFNDKLEDPFKELPEEIFKEKPQFAYVCNVIHRADNTIKLFDLKRTVFSQIVEYAQNPEYGNPSEEAAGYDITVKNEKTGPLPQNVKYTVFPGRNNSPLTDEEKEMELYDLTKMYKRQTYDEQKQWLIQNTSYFANVEGNELSGETAEDL